MGRNAQVHGNGTAMRALQCSDDRLRLGSHAVTPMPSPFSCLWRMAAIDTSEIFAIAAGVLAAVAGAAAPAHLSRMAAFDPRRP